MKLNFWLSICRFAYKRIQIAQPYYVMGVPGIRDTDSICSMYAPRKRVQGDALANCATDGHYLCGECAFSKFNPKNK